MQIHTEGNRLRDRVSPVRGQELLHLPRADLREQNEAAKERILPIKQSVV